MGKTRCQMRMLHIKKYKFVVKEILKDRSGRGAYAL
jgi:hypothetical protein